jgi:hypothetical protein
VWIDKEMLSRERDIGLGWRSDYESPCPPNLYYCLYEIKEYINELAYNGIMTILSLGETSRLVQNWKEDTERDTQTPQQHSYLTRLPSLPKEMKVGRK